MRVNTQDSNQEERTSVTTNAKAIAVAAVHRKTRCRRRLPSRDTINSKGCVVNALRAKERAAEDKNTKSSTVSSLYYTSESGLRWSPHHAGGRPSQRLSSDGPSFTYGSVASPPRASLLPHRAGCRRMGGFVPRYCLEDSPSLSEVPDTPTWLSCTFLLMSQSRLDLTSDKR